MSTQSTSPLDRTAAPGNESRVRINRLGQTLLTLTMGLYFVLVAFNNILDYGTNFKFVQHVLSMDTLSFDSKVMWHAIRTPWLHHFAYAIIIAWETLAGALCLLGGVSMLKQLRSAAFVGRKRFALLGLWIGVLLWSLAFITVGGEWFMMWESPVWNGEFPAFRMFALNSILILLLHLPEEGGAAGATR